MYVTDLVTHGTCTYLICRGQRALAVMTRAVVLVLLLAAACSGRILQRVLLDDAVKEVGCGHL